VFYAGAAGWDATDQLNGGAGFDYIYSETSANVNISGANSLIGIEEISVSEHFNLGSFTFVMNDANVAAGQTMFIHGFLPTATNPLSVNASAEADGHYTISGGAANDTLIGGALSDTLTGGGGADLLTGGGGADSFVFASAG
jgi:Ca2+-binding RTX toxin-like protein